MLGWYYGYGFSEIPFVFSGFSACEGFDGAVGLVDTSRGPLFECR